MTLEAAEYFISAMVRIKRAVYIRELVTALGDDAKGDRTACDSVADQRRTFRFGFDGVQRSSADVALRPKQRPPWAVIVHTIRVKSLRQLGRGRVI
jgi:hypothetical protein